MSINISKLLLMFITVAASLALALSLFLTVIALVDLYGLGRYIPWSEGLDRLPDLDVLTSVMSLATVLILTATFIHSRNTAADQRQEVAVSIRKQEQQASLNTLISIIHGHASVVRGFSVTLEEGKRPDESGRMPGAYQKSYIGIDVFLAMWREWIHEFEGDYSALYEYRKGKLKHYYLSLFTLLKLFRKQVEADLVDPELGAGLILCSISLHESRIIALHVKFGEDKERFIDLLHATGLSELLQSTEVDNQIERSLVPT